MGPIPQERSPTPRNIKRHGAAALQNAGAMARTPLRPRGFGVRQPHAALKSVYWQVDIAAKRVVLLTSAATSDLKSFATSALLLRINQDAVVDQHDEVVFPIAGEVSHHGFARFG